VLLFSADVAPRHRFVDQAEALLIGKWGRIERATGARAQSNFFMG